MSFRGSTSTLESQARRARTNSAPRGMDGVSDGVLLGSAKYAHRMNIASLPAYGNCNSTLATLGLCALTPPGARAYMRERMLAHAHMRTHVMSYARVRTHVTFAGAFMWKRARMRQRRAPACMQAWSVPYAKHGQALWQLAV